MEEIATAAIALTCLGATALRKKKAKTHTITVDCCEAVEAFLNNNYVRINGKPLPNHWSPLSGFYKTRDDKWVQIYCQFEHFRKGVVNLLACSENRPSVEQGLSVLRSWPLLGQMS